MNTSPVSYKRHRFPPQIIAHAVWLYFRFPLSLRLVEELLLERGIAVSYETIRRWGKKFGPEYARRLRRKKPSGNDVWHLDEVVITIAGRKRWLWRAVDQDGYVLDEIVQTRRNTKAARRLLTRLLRKQGIAPKRMITDKLRSYGAARRQVMPYVEHRSHKGLNNRAENSHVPLRKRERMMQGFRSRGGLQHFVSAFSAVRNLFVPPAHNAPHSKTAFTVSRRSQSGTLRPEPWPEINPQGRSLPYIRIQVKVTSPLQQMRDKMYRLSRRLHRIHPERLSLNAQQHRAIVDAIREGEIEKSRKSMQAHLAWGRAFTLDPNGRMGGDWQRLTVAAG